LLRAVVSPTPVTAQVMKTSQFMLEHLFKPLTIGPTTLANRIVSTAHQTNLVHGNLPTDDFVAYHEERARGGVGLIVLEATAVHESGRLTAHTLAGFRVEIVEAYRRLAETVRPHDTRLFVQLFHGGRELIASRPQPPAVAPSPLPTQRFHREPRALLPDEIEAIVEGYGRAARLAADGGLDGIELSAAHNYLIAQFFTPELNRREDEWRDGKRFLLAVIDAVRTAAPGLALGVRLSADATAARNAAPAIADRVDFLHVALGDSSTYRGSLQIVPPPPEPESAIDAWTEPFRLGVPLIATSRVIDPLAADRLVRESRADAVGMTRALITDPELARKAREGLHETILRCIGCNACIEHYHAGTPIACTQNPRTGRERSLRPPRKGPVRRRIVVVGAGPAGLAAAADASGSGHEVILLEQGPEIGGQLALAGAAPGGAEICRSLRSNYERLLGEVDVRLGTAAGLELVTGLGPDGVVVATGAKPHRPDLALDGVEVLQGWDVLAGDLPHGGGVVVADWGGDTTGLDAAEVLAAAGSAVTLAVGSVTAGEGVHQYRRNLYLARLYRAGVRVLHHLELAGADSRGIRFRNVFAPELESVVEAETLVLSLGREPVDDLVSTLAALDVPVRAAGDCLSPRSAEEAILEGTLAAREVASS
jgi:2,4-dienoyl-CoA reductase-like NADH-dependent reductase (Old Yellow Enzyme family)/thioredoxin reductase